MICEKKQNEMKVFEYISVKEDLFSKELGKYSTFGIKVYLIVDDKYEIGIASDVSDDKMVVDRIAGYCNNRQINPIDLLSTVSMFV